MKSAHDQCRKTLKARAQRAARKNSKSSCRLQQALTFLALLDRVIQWLKWLN